LLIVGQNTFAGWWLFPIVHLELAVRVMAI